ncbi:unnamed protein product [Nesidiocoris tenuis]|uniref:Uncharacterized protein n=1 Tax=Nesidiocoris tenuis TaxID=355587 RepID=A0A6H5GIB0_9HEMI|nr:unnamed protein product [Nesidiocoris tenuis]
MQSREEGLAIGTNTDSNYTAIQSRAGGDSGGGRLVGWPLRTSPPEADGCGAFGSHPCTTFFETGDAAIFGSENLQCFGDSARALSSDPNQTTSHNLNLANLQVICRPIGKGFIFIPILPAAESRVKLKKSILKNSKKFNFQKSIIRRSAEGRLCSNEFWSFDHRYSTERNLFLNWRNSERPLSSVINGGIRNQETPHTAHPGFGTGSKSG